MRCLISRYSILLPAASIALVGCLQPSTTTVANESINQQDICEVKEWRADAVSQACKPGQKVVFLPNSWGNAQLPILFAAVNCDLRYSVALTEGAVTCIYQPISVKQQ